MLALFNNIRDSSLSSSSDNDNEDWIGNWYWKWRRKWWRFWPNGRRGKLWLGGMSFETLTIIEESYNNDEGSSLPTCENQTLLPPSLQVREKLKETSSVLNFEGFKKEDGRINQAVIFCGQCGRNLSLKS